MKLLGTLRQDTVVNTVFEDTAATHYFASPQSNFGPMATFTEMPVRDCTRPKADTADAGSPIAINVVFLRAIRVVSGILATIDLDDMSVRMLSPFYFSHDVATWNDLPGANIVMLIPPSGAVASPFNPSHSDVLRCAEWSHEAGV